MKLHNLRLRNFKGIESFTLNTDGLDTNVSGQNGTGKTTLADAWFWLLFNKDSLNKADIEIKPLKPEGEPEHNLESEVEAVVEVSGQSVTLAKTFKEKWTKKRGKARAEFTGHETTYKIDGTPVKQNEYKKRVADLVGSEDGFKLLTNPRYFAEVMKWQDRRKLLLEVCGDVDDSQVIESNSELAELPDILNGKNLDDLKKTLTSQRQEINKELQAIPTRIDEVKRGLPDVSEGSPAVIQGELVDLKQQRKQRSEEYAQVSAGDNSSIRKELSEIGMEIDNVYREHRKQQDKKLEDLNKQRRELEDEETELSSKISLISSEITRLEKWKVGKEEEIEQLRSDYRKIQAQEYEGDNVCPTCGQSLPEEQAKDAIAHFNNRKAINLENVTKQGKDARSHIEETNAEIEKQNAELEQKQERLATVLHEKIKEAKEAGEPDVSELQAKREQLESQLEQDMPDKSRLQAIQNEINELDSQIEEKENWLARLQEKEKGQERIKELSEQEKKLAGDYEEIERQIYLCEQFVVSKVNLLEDKINSYFKLARFKLFEQQINEGIKETCEVTYLGVPYNSGLNNGARLNCGMDIINTLSRHYGFTAPIFIDNAEAVNELIETTGQQIRLYVSEHDSLIVENKSKEEVSV